MPFPSSLPCRDNGPLKRLGGGQCPSFPWHARPQSHEIQDFLLKFLLIFHQSEFLQRIL